MEQGRSTVIRVAAVDPHPTMLLGVTTLIGAQPDMRLVATAATVPELLQQRRGMDVVLLAPALADGSTPAMNQRALEAAGVPVLAFGDGERSTREAVRAGAVGVVRKTEPADAVIRAVRQAAQGDTGLVGRAVDPGATAVAHLTAREKQVLTLYASGETAERVAAKLFVSVETVIDHIRRIRGKYASAGRPAPTKIDLYRRAQEDGLLPL